MPSSTQRQADTAQAFINLALALGLPGRQASGYGTITGQGNGQGGREHGQKADQLPGYRRLDDPAARAHVAAVWGVEPEDLPRPGKSAFEMIDRLGSEGGVRALLVLASNIAVFAPDANRVRNRLAALDLLVVSDIFLSETAALADVVLPTAQWAEEDGTMTNLEGRVIRRRKALPPPAGVLDDLQMLARLAVGLAGGSTSRPTRQWCSPNSAGPAPVASPTTPASPTTGSTPRRASSGRAPALITPERRGCSPTDSRHPTAAPGSSRWPSPVPGEKPDAGYPYVLTTGRLLTQYQSGAQTRRLHPTMVPDPHVQIHPDLARRLDLAASDIVELRTRRGAAVFRVQLADAIRPGVLFVPFHWGGASNANSLTDPTLDPLSKMPEFKSCAVSLTRVGGPDDLALLTTVPRQPAVARFTPARPSPVRQTPPTRRPTRSRPTSPKDARMHTKNRFLQGIYQFTGTGIDKASPLDTALSYVVPDGSVAQALYFRGGNTADELIALVLMRDGVPMRYFPIGAKSDVHVPLRVVEDLEGGTVVELHLAAPDGLTGSVIVDIGLVEV